MPKQGSSGSQHRCIDIHDVQALYSNKRLRERGGDLEIRIPCPVHNGTDDNCLVLQGAGGRLRAFCKAHQC